MKILDVNPEQLVSIGIHNILQQQYHNVKFITSIDKNEILTLLETHEFDIILIDVGITFLDIFEIMAAFQEKQKNAKVLIFSHTEYKQYVFQYISYGACGFLDKSSSEKEVKLAIRLITSGNIYFPKEMLISYYNYTHYHNLSSGRKVSFSPIDRLSNRELEAFKMLIKGKRVKDISETMNIHQSTTSCLKRKIMEKLNVDNLLKLKIIALEYGYTI